MGLENLQLVQTIYLPIFKILVPFLMVINFSCKNRKNYGIRVYAVK